MELSEVLEDLGDQADISLQARGVNGVVDGYVIDGVTSLASAISPLIDAYNFDVCEGRSELIAKDQAVQVQVDLTGSDFVEDSWSEIIPLLDKQPSGVSLSYISGDFSYQPAIASMRYPGADQSFVVQSSIPLVLNEARARVIADRQYQHLHLANTLTLSLPPESAIALEVVDLVSLNDTPWRIERTETRGLDTRFLLRDASQTFSPQRALNAPNALEPIFTATEPDFVIIDGPRLASNDAIGPVVAVSGMPWPGAVPILAGVTETALSTVAVANQPAGLGRTSGRLASGPLGRWDRSACVELDISGEEFASAERIAVLSGANRLLLENDEGWELIAWQDAELVGENRWRLKHLLRGLTGTPIRVAQADALAVRVDDRLISVPLGEEEAGVSLIWKVGDGDAIEFTYEDRASLPWRVGHLRVARSGGELNITWTPRGVEYSNNWSLPDDLRERRFRIELCAGETLISGTEQSEAFLTIPIGTADTARVAPIGLHQRLGEWVSIPLPPP